MIDKFLRFRENPVWKALLKIQELILVLTSALCCLIFVAEVIARYMLKIDFLGYDELVLIAAVWLYFIGGAYAMYKKEHISADMLSLMLKGRGLRTSRVIVSWLTFFVVLVLAIWGVDFFMYATTRVAKTTVWKIPHLWSQSVLTIGYILMAFYSLVYAIEDTILLVRGWNKPDDEEQREGDCEK